MNTLKLLECPVCGGSLDKLSENAYKCKYCGNVLEQKPALPDDVTHNLLSAVQLRRAYEFAKAGDAYAAVLENHRDICEANWGAFLCRYGVNYVPGQDGKYHPTFWRVDNHNVMGNTDYKTALALCGEETRNNYRERGEEIEALRAAIVKRIKKGCDEEIYLCTRQMPGDGGRETFDEERRLTDETYAFLIRQGYRVFYEPKSLSTKHSLEVEPEIFAAINSCRLMLVPECANAESKWIKDKYMRFKALAQAGSGKSIGVITLSGLVSSPFLAGCSAYNGNSDGYYTKLYSGVKMCVGVRLSEEEKAEQVAQKEAAAKIAAENEKTLKSESPPEKQQAAVSAKKQLSQTEVAATGENNGVYAQFSVGKNSISVGNRFKGIDVGAAPNLGRINVGAIETDPKALREIAQTVRSYCFAQNRITEGYSNSIKSLTQDWDDEGYRQLLAAVTGIRGKLSSQLISMESFASFLEQKANILERMPK